MWKERGKETWKRLKNKRKKNEKKKEKKEDRKEEKKGDARRKGEKGQEDRKYVGGWLCTRRAWCDPKRLSVAAHHPHT